MKPKIYLTEKVEQVAKVLAEAPVLPPKYITHEDAITKLFDSISNLYSQKNYDARQIVQLLKRSGIRTTLKEVRGILAQTQKVTKKNEKKMR